MAGKRYRVTVALLHKDCPVSWDDFKAMPDSVFKVEIWQRYTREYSRGFELVSGDPVNAAWQLADAVAKEQGDGWRADWIGMPVEETNDDRGT